MSTTYVSSQDEEDDDFSRLEDEECERLHSQMLSQRLAMQPSSCALQEWSNEKNLIHQIANEGQVILLLDHKAFPRCSLIKQKLSLLAPRKPNTRFYSILAKDAPFLTGKFFIRTLPTILIFTSGGQCLDCLVGFEELGGKDDFELEVLERRLSKKLVDWRSQGEEVARKIA